MPDRMCKESITCNATYLTHGTKDYTIRITSRSQTENRINKLSETEKSFLSNWSEISISLNSRPKIPIYVTRNGDGEISNHIVMARKKAEEKALVEKSPQKKFG